MTEPTPTEVIESRGGSCATPLCPGYGCAETIEDLRAELSMLRADMAAAAAAGAPTWTLVVPDDLMATDQFVFDTAAIAEQGTAFDGHDRGRVIVIRHSDLWRRAQREPRRDGDRVDWRRYLAGIDWPTFLAETRVENALGDVAAHIVEALCRRIEQLADTDRTWQTGVQRLAALVWGADPDAACGPADLFPVIEAALSGRLSWWVQRADGEPMGDWHGMSCDTLGGAAEAVDDELSFQREQADEYADDEMPEFGVELLTLREVHRERFDVDDDRAVIAHRLAPLVELAGVDVEHMPSWYSDERAGG